MKNSKKLFIAFAFIFLIVLLVIGWDISRQTTFPGSKKNLKERIENPTK